MAALSAPDSTPPRRGRRLPARHRPRGALGRALRLAARAAARAWEAVRRVLAPVAISQATPLGETTVPRFARSTDHRRLQPHLPAPLRGPHASGAHGARSLPRSRRGRCGVRVRHRGPRHARYLDAGALGRVRRVVPDTGGRRVDWGVHRISMSPGLTRHLVESYPEELRCLAEGAPPAQVPLEPRTDRLARSEIVLTLRNAQLRSLLRHPGAHAARLARAGDARRPGGDPPGPLRDRRHDTLRIARRRARPTAPPCSRCRSPARRRSTRCWRSIGTASCHRSLPRRRAPSRRRLGRPSGDA